MAIRRTPKAQPDKPDTPDAPVVDVKFDVKYRIRGDDRLFTRGVGETEERGKQLANMLWEQHDVVEVQFLLVTTHMVGRKIRD